MEKKTSVSDAELEILEVLWASGKPLNTTEIRGLLEKNKKWERTTVLTLIQRLVKKECWSRRSGRFTITGPAWSGKPM